jgi:hypothetical protein
MTTAITIVICTACVAIALIVAAVIIAGKQMETEPKPAEAKTPDVLYLCDRSGWCGCDKCGECRYTCNIDHAVNFERNAEGFYCERPRVEEGLCVGEPVDFGIKPLGEYVHCTDSSRIQRAAETLKKNNGME